MDKTTFDTVMKRYTVGGGDDVEGAFSLVQDLLEAEKEYLLKEEPQATASIQNLATAIDEVFSLGCEMYEYI